MLLLFQSQIPPPTAIGNFGFDVLKLWVYNPFRYSASTSISSNIQPLKNMTFVLSGRVDKEKLQNKIEALGGKLSNKVTENTTALISEKGKETLPVIIEYI